MTLSELVPLLRDLGVQPSRKLGQNFLIDSNTLDRIVDVAAPRPGERLLEIGAGTGTLTRALLARGAEVIAVEYDARLYEYLHKAFAETARLRLVQADACRLDYSELMGPEPFACVANLPYAVSSVILAHLLELDNRPRRLCVLLQREMGERLTAGPGTKEYGALSVRTQALYRVTLERIIPPTVFYPPPEVESAAVLLTATDGAMEPAAYRDFSTLVKIAFSQRRKMLHKLLKSAWPSPVLDAAFERVDIDRKVRAEALTIAQFRALHAALHSPAQD